MTTPQMENAQMTTEQKKKHNKTKYYRTHKQCIALQNTVAQALKSGRVTTGELALKLGLAIKYIYSLRLKYVQRTGDWFDTRLERVNYCAGAARLITALGFSCERAARMIGCSAPAIYSYRRKGITGKPVKLTFELEEKFLFNSGYWELLPGKYVVSLVSNPEYVNLQNPDDLKVYQIAASALVNKLKYVREK